MIPFQVITIQSIAFLKEQQTHQRTGPAKELLLSAKELKTQHGVVQQLSESCVIASRTAFTQGLLRDSAI